MVLNRYTCARAIGVTARADQGIFVSVCVFGGRGVGAPGQSVKKKSSDNVFLVLNLLFYISPMVYFKEIYNYSWFQRESNIFQGGGGVQLFQGGGGSNCLFPIETHISKGVGEYYVLWILSQSHLRHYSIVMGSKSKWVWSWNSTITLYRPSHGTVKKSHRTFIVTIHL